ncbi:PilZ domain-containing protein [Altericroceibacterium spongiae]|uniref:PilZ domain-containing protein n=1 Tax=Altericroceibacterium spongiae TaxID=2320269 RepID=A0A420EIV2_9SPHN|nr:PilZ domain-containing protein [Altericroceibacterium spongiae]RKF20598.1 PilZ domain-containing protein [Altericroceibacterium spongiae]
MAKVDTRQVSRDSLFLLAQLRVDGSEQLHTVRVRNLSSRGMMAEGDVKVMRGTQLSVELRNIGWVEGTVAWTQDNRFGIAFIDEIDAKQVRNPVNMSGDLDTPRYTRTAVGKADDRDPKKLRKI